MVELQHRAIPTPLLTDLNQDQGGLCVYCEGVLAAEAGQVEHIKPKAGPRAHPHLCFTYSNYAHSCIKSNTCGQKKQDGLLPIEPGPGCNAEWSLSIDGTIEPVAGLTKNRRHEVRQTRDMLGLNADPNLVEERRRGFINALEILRQYPDDLPAFLATAPYRYIIGTAC